MLNLIWLGMILVAFVVACASGRLDAVNQSAITSARGAVELCVGLVGIMALWLGMMRLAEKSGLVLVLARLLKPLLRRLFPDVPADHPAMGEMVLNMAANMLGLSNAATPLGIRAMQSLEKINPNRGTASNAMCTFLAINTSSIQLVPATTVAMLAAAGSTNPTAIIGTAFLATACSTVAGITSVKFLEKLPVFRIRRETDGEASEAVEMAGDGEVDAGGLDGDVAPGALGIRAKLALTGYVGILAYAAWQIVVSQGGEGGHWAMSAISAISILAIPALLAFFPLYAALRKVPVYEAFVDGAKDGFQVAVRIIPFLVGMLTAIGMLRASGAIDAVTRFLAPALDKVGFPPDLLPLVLMRPLSGAGSNGIFAEMLKTFGPDSEICRIAATVIGSTETTFYVVAVYFGAVAVKRTRHAIPAGLIADMTGVVAAIVIWRVLM